MSLCKALRLNIWNTKVHSFITKVAVYMKGLFLMNTDQLGSMQSQTRDPSRRKSYLFKD